MDFLNTGKDDMVITKCKDDAVQIHLTTEKTATVSGTEKKVERDIYFKVIKKDGVFYAAFQYEIAYTDTAADSNAGSYVSGSSDNVFYPLDPPTLKAGDYDSTDAVYTDGDITKIIKKFKDIYNETM